MSAIAIFQYLDSDLKNMGYVTEMISPEKEIKKNLLVFSHPEPQYLGHTTVVYCEEPNEFIKNTYLLRFITTLEVKTTNFVLQLVNKLNIIYPLVKFSTNENKVFMAIDSTLHTKFSWQSEQMISNLAFYAATMMFVTPVLEDLANEKITLDQAIKKIQK